MNPVIFVLEGGLVVQAPIRIFDLFLTKEGTDYACKLNLQKHGLELAHWPFSLKRDEIDCVSNS